MVSFYFFLFFFFFFFFLSTLLGTDPYLKEANRMAKRAHNSWFPHDRYDRYDRCSRCNRGKKRDQWSLQKPKFSDRYNLHVRWNKDHLGKFDRCDRHDCRDRNISISVIAAIAFPTVQSLQWQTKAFPYDRCDRFDCWTRFSAIAAIVAIIWKPGITFHVSLRKRLLTFCSSARLSVTSFHCSANYNKFNVVVVCLSKKITLQRRRNCCLVRPQQNIAVNFDRSTRWLPNRSETMQNIVSLFYSALLHGFTGREFVHSMTNSP